MYTSTLTITDLIPVGFGTDAVTLAQWAVGGDFFVGLLVFLCVLALAPLLGGFFKNIL